MKASRTLVLAAVVAVATARTSLAGSLGTNPAVEAGGWTPRVPISSLARPMVGIDPSRLHFATSVSFGTGFGGKSEGLQVTRVSYQFRAPVAMSVSVGNMLGSTSGRNGNSFFLEGMDLTYRPSANTLFSIHYQDLRSRLQYGGFGAVNPYWVP